MPTGRGPPWKPVARELRPDAVGGHSDDPDTLSFAMPAAPLPMPSERRFSHPTRAELRVSRYVRQLAERRGLFHFLLDKFLEAVPGRRRTLPRVLLMGRSVTDGPMDEKGNLATYLPRAALEAWHLRASRRGCLY